jgi:hypothetical protein
MMRGSIVESLPGDHVTITLSTGASISLVSVIVGVILAMQTDSAEITWE